VKISSELKKKMKRYTQINWSEIMRKAVEREIENQTEKNIAKAVLINEEIRKKAPEDYDSVNIIRCFREERY
jgi:hypothetical protein